MELPVMVYRPGSMFEWDGEWFDYLILDTDEGLKAALADGWDACKPQRNPLDHDGDGKSGGSLPDTIAPRKRGRKPKGAA